MKPKWHRFDKNLGSQQKRPPIGRAVLVLCERNDEIYVNPISVGYRKDAAGDKQCPYFVIPGIGGEALAWCDCLPDNFKIEDWPKLPNEKVTIEIRDLFRNDGSEPSRREW